MFKDIITTLKNGVRLFKFNRPEKKNAITGAMYKHIRNTLKKDAEDDKVVMTIFTGSGDFYSSGNDFKDSMASAATADYTKGIDDKVGEVELFVDAMINYPKLTVAVVNGPAIGIAATTAALCDIVYASESAYFHTPFVQLGLCPEGASSYIFPRILGRSKASEMLFLNKKLTAQEAFRLGFVAKLFPNGLADATVEELHAYGEKLPVHSVKIVKELISANLNSILCECNKRESVRLKEVMKSEAFFNAIALAMNRKSKL